MKCGFLLKILIILNYINNGKSAKILGICNVPNRSHFKIASSLLNGLAEKGHEVTIASPYFYKNKTKNVKHIFIDGVLEIAIETSKTWSSIHSSGIISFYEKYKQFSYKLSEATLNSKNINKLLSSQQNYDLVIFDLFQNHAFFGFAGHFNASTIILSTGSSFQVNGLAGNLAPYSFVPNKFTTYSDKMNFLEKIYNIFYSLYITLQEELIIIPQQKTLYDKHFNTKIPFKDAVKSTSLFLINSHVLLETPRPYLPNMIPVAGLHINTQKLPQDLQDYLDTSKNGVILFSLGSVVNPKNLPNNIKQDIIKVFGRLSQNILWKFEDVTQVYGKNIKVSNWWPQNDILSHPNVKLFITHGGLLSCIEALHHGVPILGIPFFGDQFGNIRQFVDSGYGRELMFQDLSELTFFNSIQEVLNNKSYINNIKEASNIFKHRLNAPLNEAVFWVEHVLKHKGGKHLQSQSVHITWIEYLLLDIILSYLIILCIVIFVIKYLCKRKRVHQKSKIN